MKISFAITTHNEGREFTELMESLLTQLQRKVVPYDHEIVILDDASSNFELIEAFRKFQNVIRVEKHAFQGDFAAHKNYLSSLCTGDWIFQLDADELPPFRIVENLPNFFASNPFVDVFDIPRLNTVFGITDRHIQQWGWKISSSPNIVKEEPIDTEGQFFDLLQKHDFVLRFDAAGGGVRTVKYMVPIINFPDAQKRLWKNNVGIHWEGRIHETLVGYKTLGHIPPVVELAIHHHKTIQKQEYQNQLYTNLMR